MRLSQKTGRSGATARLPDLEVGEETGLPWLGFGGCFNELGWRALSRLSAKERALTLDKLFAPGVGLQFEFCRLPIGANDYAEDWYSHAETPGDFELKHFSIERDRRALIPYVNEARRRQPGLELFASPWSPPTWMKNPPVFNSGKLRDDKRHLDAYARYLLKFVQAYAEEGIPIGQLHVQNEPVSSQKFPSCVITGEEFKRFIGNHLGPVFAKAGCGTEIWLGTINGPETDDRKYWSGFNDYAFTVMEDPKAVRHVKGVSYQWAGKHAVWRTRLAYPDLPMIQSENECGEGANSWNYAWYIADLVHHYLAQGVDGYVYWNMALEPGGESTWGWKQNSLFTVDPETGSLTTNPEYHVMRHYAGFVRRGDRRLRCARPWAANTVAFCSATTGERVVVIRNPFATERVLRIAAGSELWAVTLPGDSLATVRLPAPSGAK